VKKWKCSVCGHVYDPERETAPGEVTGAAKCGFVDERGELVESFTCKMCGAMKESFTTFHES